MSSDSAFLFDDRESFFYGEVIQHRGELIDDFVYVEMRASRPKPKSFFLSMAFAAIVASGFVFKSTASPSYQAIRTRAEAWKYEYVDDSLRRKIIENREFIGITQGDLSEILGLDISTVQKFEQGYYSSHRLETLRQFEEFNNWVSMLREHYDNIQFVVRPLIRTANRLLGGKTPLEYAKAQPREGLADLISLQQRIQG